MGGRKILSTKEKQLVGVIAIVVVVIAILCFSLGYMLFMKYGTNRHDNSQQHASNGAVSDSLQGYISNYFQDENAGGMVSDAVMERIVAEITTGVLNSLPNIMQNDAETVTYIRKMISESVTEEIKDYNEQYLASGGYEYTTTISNDLLYYIDNVVIPIITAELQMDEGETKDLIETLIHSSEIYKENNEYFETLIKEIEQELKVINIESNTYEEDIVELLNHLKELEVVLTDYKSQTAVQITNYDMELSSIKTMIQEYYVMTKEYTDAEIAIIKEELDAALVDMENNESIKNIINNVEIKNEQDLLKLEQILKEEIYNNHLANTEEMESIMGVLDETINGLQSKVSLLSMTLEQLTARQIEELRRSLQDQIDANIMLTNTQKKDLEASIDKATSDTSLSVEETKKALEEDIKKRTNANTEALNRFIETLYGDADDKITIEGILSQIKESTDLSKEQKDALVEMIEAKYSNIASNITTQVNEVKENLRKEVRERNEIIDKTVSSLMTSLETKVAELEKRVNKLISNQIDALKNNLLIQIQNNKDLSEEQKTELENEILNLAQNSTTAEELNTAVADLTTKITQSSEANKEALKDAIDKLLGEGSTNGITIAELEKRIENADISEEEKKQLTDAISKVYADATADTKVKVGEVKDALQKEIEMQTEKFTNAVISLQTELEIQIANIEARLTKLTEAQIETVKNNLLLQIQNNRELSDEQKEELEKDILDLAQNSATAEGLSLAIAELTTKIAQSTEASRVALNKAINDLLGEGFSEGITIAELEKRILAADISAEEKQMLNDAIARVYADATTDTTVKVGEVREALQEEIDEQAKSFTSAVTSLQTEMEVQIANIEVKLMKLTEAQIETVKNSLLLQIQSNKELSDEQKAELEEEILTLAQKSATAEDLTAAIAELNVKISQNTQAGMEALNEAINKLLGEGSTEGITIAELEERIANADISAEEKKKLNDAIAKVYADTEAGVTVKVEEVKSALQAEISEQAAAFTKAVSLLETELEIQIANIETRLTKMTEEQIEAVKNNLLLQIQNNKKLSDEQKTELKEEILNLAQKSATVEELSLAIAELTTKISQSTEESANALNAAINNLLGEGSTEGITIAELEERIANADISDEEKQKLNDAIAKVYADATNNTMIKVDEAKVALQEEISNQAMSLTDAMMSLQIDLEIQIANLEAKLTDLTETQLEALKNSLEDQILANTELTLKQKEELWEEIADLENSTANTIIELEAIINAKTKENADALSNFIRTLYGDASGDITIGELLDQIEANTKLTNDQKKTLTELIEKRYTDATENTTLRVEDAKAVLQEEIDTQVEILNNAVDSLMESLEDKVKNLNAVIDANKATQEVINTNQANTNQSLANKDSQLESNINANKTAQDVINSNQANTNQNLQNQLDSITSSLEGDCEIKYVNGEFIIYNPDGTVAKKLVFAE